MAVNAGLGAATGAASGGLKGALVGAVGGAAGAAVRSFTGGAVTVGLSYSAENGFGASVGVGYGPANVTVGISEKGGATVDLGFNKGGFNAGLSYNSKTGKASGSVGLEISQGSSLGISYNEGDGFGASISKSLDNGINGSLSWSEKGGVGGNIGYEVPGDKNKSKDSLANKMQGSGGSLNWSQRDGVSIAVNASGGVNAGNWSQSGGFQANTNFLNDQWKANFVSKQGAIEELQSKGLSKEQATAILDASAQEESKAAQNKNNQETGKSVLDGAGISTQRREGEGHVIGFSDDGPEPAHGNPGVHDTGQTITSSGSVEGTGVSRQLSAADIAEFKADWRKESPAQTDASLAALKSAGYDTSGLEKFVTDYRNGKAANSSQGSTPTTQTTHQSQGPTVLYGGAIQNALSSIADGAKGLWNKMTGGSPQGVYNSAGIEAGIDKVLASKAAYDPGYEQKGANWTPGKLENGERYSNIHYTQSKDADGNTVYEKVYRNYDSKEGKYTVAGTESVTAAAYNAAIGSGDYQRFTSCNMVNHEIATSFGAVSPFMPEKAGTQYHANDNPNTGKKGIYGNLQNGKYDTDTHQYRQVGFEDAEKNASRGGLSIAVNDGHIVTVTGGYTGTQGKASDLNIFQGGKSGVGPMTIQNGFGYRENQNPGYYSNGKKLQYYVWEKK
ncbi:hypothetical protein [Leptospira interrogans]|uniref:hypothetical protein n=1 Tax=Leptospira interrogans TaxID=173 RepID=UPI0002B9C65F|nr:hypothetical protein LEP1GSC106_3700 [Leptospira interrogans serovar Grippotyphosa str. UI 12764]